MDNELENWRKQIDALDDELLRILGKRFNIAMEIGKIKKAQGISPFDQKRWQTVINTQLLKAKENNLERDFVEKLYHLIHEYSLKTEGTTEKYIREVKNKLTIGIQGGRGSFNEEAVNYFLKKNPGRKYSIKYLFTAENVLKSLYRGKIDRGQLAIHNSVGGIVEESINALATYKVKIVENFAIKIAHALMTRQDARMSDITTIMTHPQVYAQCQKTLSAKYPQLKKISAKGVMIDQAQVAKKLAENKLPKNTATMGSALLARIFELKIVAENLQDSKENFTSFLQIERL